MLPLFGGGHRREQICDYDCLRFRVNVSVNTSQKKKVAPSTPTRSNFSIKKEELSDQPYLVSEKAYFDPSSDEFVRKSIMAQNQMKNNKIVSELWLSKEFPLRFDHFKQVLDALSLSGNP